MRTMMKRVIVVVLAGCALGMSRSRTDHEAVASGEGRISRGVGAEDRISLLVPLAEMSTAQAKPVPVEKEPHHKAVFKNQYVQIFRVQLDPGKTGLMHTHFHDDASVRLTTATVAADSPGESIGAPEPVYPGLLSARDNEAKPLTHRVHGCNGCRLGYDFTQTFDS